MSNIRFPFSRSASFFLTFTLFISTAIVSSQNIMYQIHEQSHGWSKWVRSGETIGVDNKRIEAIRIKPIGFDSDVFIEYNSHVQGIGDFKRTFKNGEMSGTTGQSKRLEALWVKIHNAPGYSLCYTVIPGEREGKSPWPFTINVDLPEPSQNCDGGWVGSKGRRRPLYQISIVLLKNGIPVTKEIEEPIEKIEDVTFTREFYSKYCTYDVYYSFQSPNCSSMKYWGKIGKGKKSFKIKVSKASKAWIRIKKQGYKPCNNENTAFYTIDPMLIPRNMKRSVYYKQEIRNLCSIKISP